ncbi:protein of unknown function [Pseudomonas sp. JV551A1]|uniref:Uncharacterized protein n=1 Tax=Pseudomonas inefficax TaxID=2078786 RepID=A0AAQ1PE65_9PSED|nr:protein of unknown function [Pseudomonas sp. JV551A1]SPO64002.1 protein of unknown function [Pseudomonas inefficax]
MDYREIRYVFCNLAIKETLTIDGAFAVASAGPFAGKPAPTGPAQASGTAPTLWERVYPRKGRHC